MKTANILVAVNYLAIESNGCTKAVLAAKVADKKFEFSWELTKHFKQRCKERGLTIENALVILDLGETVETDGYLFHAISKQLVKQVKASSAYRKLMGWVVVESPDAKLITCYYAGNGHRYINKKREFMEYYSHPH